MRPLDTYRSIKHFVYFVRCAVVLFGFNMGPPFAVHKAGGDYPDLGATTATMRFVTQTDRGEFFSDMSDVPAAALRLAGQTRLNRDGR